MNIKNQTGFTIVEVIIVIAISSALAASIMIWQGSINERARFANAIEDLDAKLSEVRTSVFSTVNQNQIHDCAGGETVISGGSNTDCVVYGIAIQFTAGSEEAFIRPLLADRTQEFDEEITGLLRLAPQHSDYPMKWGLQFDGGARAGNPNVNTIVMIRNFQTGQLEVHTIEVPGTSAAALMQLRDRANYTVSSRSQPAEFIFSDPSGQTAYICVNQTRDSIVRSFNEC